MDLEDRDFYRFNRKGTAFVAAKRRKTLTVKEFAELLADIDPRKIDGYNDAESSLYAEEVEPVLSMLIDWIEVQNVTPSKYDDIPF